MPLQKNLNEINFIIEYFFNDLEIVDDKSEKAH
jgi:hypothetical protein